MAEPTRLDNGGDTTDATGSRTVSADSRQDGLGADSGSPAAGRATEEQTQPVSRLARVFGDRVASEKPLDEMVLDYLVENARKRKRGNK